jgi:hypothetical protein
MPWRGMLQLPPCLTDSLLPPFCRLMLSEIFFPIPIFNHLTCYVFVVFAQTI